MYYLFYTEYLHYYSGFCKQHNDSLIVFFFLHLDFDFQFF